MLSKKYVVLATIMGGLFAATNASATQLAGGPHDLTVGSGGVEAAAGPTDACRYCHTPHNGDSLVPLWGRTMPADGSGFEPYTSTTMSAANSPARISLGCLTCHDGVTAFDAIVGGANGGAGNATGNVLLSSNSAYIGTDLKDDHPVSVSYDAAATDTNGGMVAWGTVSSTNLKFFSDGSNLDMVECATCHEPHDVDYYGSTGSTGKFLRVDPAGMCATCHDK